jgi:hypothetical protein
MGSGRDVHMSKKYIRSRRFDFSTADLRKITTKHKAKFKKGSDGLPPIKTTCAKWLSF